MPFRLVLTEESLTKFMADEKRRNGSAYLVKRSDFRRVHGRMTMGEKESTRDASRGEFVVAMSFVRDSQ